VREDYNEDGNLTWRWYFDADGNWAWSEEYYYNEDKSLNSYAKNYEDADGKWIWESYLFSGLLDTRDYWDDKKELSVTETFDPWGWMRKYNLWGDDPNFDDRWMDAYYFKDGSLISKNVWYTDKDGVFIEESFKGPGVKLVEYYKSYEDKDGNRISEHYNADYSLKEYTKSFFDKKLGKDVEEFYNKDKKLKEIRHYSENADGQDVTEYLDANGLLWNYAINYTNDEGYDVTEKYNNAGVLVDYYAYDSKTLPDGKEMFSNYSKDGWQTDYTLSYRNAAGQYINEYYDHTGKTGSTLAGISDNDVDYRDVYDAKGNLLKKHIYDKYGNLIKTYHHDYKWFPNNTASSFGPKFRDAKPGMTDKWYMFTPLDLTQQGTRTYDLVASNMYLIGKVNVTVNGDEVVITYGTVHNGRGNQKIESEYLNLLPDLASVTTVEPASLGEGYKFGQPISIEKDLKGDTKVLMFVRNVITYRDHVIDGVKLTRFYPNLPHLVDLRTQMQGIMD